MRAYTTAVSKQQEQAVMLVPVSALGGGDCGLACEVCPLRPWKSAATGGVLCTTVLEAHRIQLDAQRVKRTC